MAPSMSADPCVTGRQLDRKTCQSIGWPLMARSLPTTIFLNASQAVCMDLGPRPTLEKASQLQAFSMLSKPSPWTKGRGPTHSSILMNASCKTLILGARRLGPHPDTSNLAQSTHLQNKICWVRSRLRPCHPLPELIFFCFEPQRPRADPTKYEKLVRLKKTLSRLSLKVRNVSADPVL